MRRLRLMPIPMLLLPLWVSNAWAGTFDSQGNFSFEQPTTLTAGFEAEVTLPTGLSRVVANDALEGGALVEVSSPSAVAKLPVALIPPTGKYTARLWMRHGELSAELNVLNAANLGQRARLGPTGRVTSDGWVELATNDFTIDGEVSGLSLELQGSSEVDAFELTPAGTADSMTSCSGVSDPSCGEGHLCFGGLCRSTDRLVPPMPAPEYRASSVAYLKSRFEHMFGGVKTRADYLPAALALFDEMGQAQTAWAFWNGFATAIHHLHDWHTRSLGAFGGRLAPTALGACFTTGIGDRSQTAATSDPNLPDILVTHVTESSAKGLHAGDRLVAIDGQHPITWAKGLKSVDWDYTQASDDAVTADFAERLYGLIPSFAKQLSVVRCDSAAGTCATTVDTIEVSTLDSISNQTLLRCDHRPSYHTADALAATDPYGKPLAESHQVYFGVYGGDAIEAQPDEKIKVMTWDYLYGASVGSVGQQMSQKFTSNAASWASARGVILDHRRGEGGTTDSLGPIFNGILQKNTLLVFPPLTQVDGVGGPTSDAAGLEFYQFFSQYPVANFSVGGDTPDTTLPVAVLLHRDVSASDFLALAAKKGPKMKLFGPAPTAGAFSTLMHLQYWGGIGALFASGDSVLEDGSAVLGHGVVPDVIVAPTQADLLAGKDTVYEAGLAWVRTELKP